ncbi:MAG: hypothetical protein V1701_02855 [Planctomycetota bacterium]
MPIKKNVKTKRNPKLECLCETCKNHWQAKTGEGGEINACLKNPEFAMDNNDIVIRCTQYKSCKIQYNFVYGSVPNPFRNRIMKNES